jgi:hypothetical protein
MNDIPQRTLWVQTKPDDFVHCAVLSMEPSAESGAWVVLVDSAQWLEGKHYADCSLRHDEGYQGSVWRGSYTILEHIVDLEQGFFYTKGLFCPADASPKT